MWTTSPNGPAGLSIQPAAPRRTTTESGRRRRITLEQLDAAAPATASRTLRFDFDNHDDIFAILERLEQRGDFTAQETPRFVLGQGLCGQIPRRRPAHSPDRRGVQSRTSAAWWALKCRASRRGKGVGI
ncbi:MAG: DUF3861 domain-containing protein [Azoarcus sp.]|nr:DUF3861 domain-containing protein [Azoarcus sp.]